MGSSSGRASSSVYHNVGNAIDYFNEHSETIFFIVDYEYYALGGPGDFLDGLNPGKYWNEHWFVTLKVDGEYLMLDHSTMGLKVTVRKEELIGKNRPYSLPGKYATRSRIGTSQTGSWFASVLKQWPQHYQWSSHNCQDFVCWFAS